MDIVRYDYRFTGEVLRGFRYEVNKVILYTLAINQQRSVKPERYF